MSPLQKTRERHAKLLELPDPLPPAAASDILVAIDRINSFLRRTGLLREIILKARVARSGLRGILKLL